MFGRVTMWSHPTKQNKQIPNLLKVRSHLVLGTLVLSPLTLH